MVQVGDPLLPGPYSEMNLGGQHGHSPLSVTNWTTSSFSTTSCGGASAETLKWVPRERSGHPDQPGQVVYGRTSDGRFAITPDADGDLWDLDWPVMMVDWACSAAYARWEAERTGQPWGLPGELAWEKAARGVDARIYPWGNRADPSWALSRDGHPGRMLPAQISSHRRRERLRRARDGRQHRDWCGGAPSAKSSTPPHRAGTVTDTDLECATYGVVAEVFSMPPKQLPIPERRAAHRLRGIPNRSTGVTMCTGPPQPRC